MYLSRTPNIIKPVARRFVWSIPSSEKVVYLTFDDGPTPGVTPQVLDILKSFGALATFFCIGQNVEAHPRIYRQLQAEGHAIGNHTWKHENGWRTKLRTYLRSVLRTGEVIDSTLFRPPYGRITRAQSEMLAKKYHLVMWDLLSGDFDEKRSSEHGIGELRKKTRPGSIVVFHDSAKAEKKVLEMLPVYLSFLHSEGYTCLALTKEVIESKRPWQKQI